MAGTIVRKTSTVQSNSAASEVAQAEAKNPFLVALGEHVRVLRSRRGMTRRAVALAANVSERHLANLEYGIGNASILVLVQVARALQCSLADLLGEAEPGATQRPRVALIGLRGAGKSTLGKMLADDLGCPFIELGREIEKLAGCRIDEVYALYGSGAYRRYARRALEIAVQGHVEAVIATPGGLVTDAASYRLLRSHCTTVWLQARPEDHMQRVIAQGDLRAIVASSEAMDDLKSILASREALYAKADLKLDTSQNRLAPTFKALRRMVRRALELSA